MLATVVPRQMENQLRSPGFTLVELIVVMVVLGILAAVFIPRSNSSAIVVSSQAEQLAADIRYVQSLSMTQGQRYRIVIDPATSPPSYFFNDLAANPVAHPSGTTGSVSLAGGVSITLTNLPNKYLYFDGLGRPYTATGPVTLLASTATISVTSGTSTRAVQIFPETGMVRVQ